MASPWCCQLTTPAPASAPSLYHNVIRPGSPDSLASSLYHATCRRERCCYRADAPAPPSMHSKPSPLVSSQRAPALDERLIYAARGSLFPVSQQVVAAEDRIPRNIRWTRTRCRGQTVPRKAPSPVSLRCQSCLACRAVSVWIDLPLRHLTGAPLARATSKPHTVSSSPAISRRLKASNRPSAFRIIRACCSRTTSCRADHHLARRGPSSPAAHAICFGEGKQCAVGRPLNQHRRAADLPRAKRCNFASPMPPRAVEVDASAPHRTSSHHSGM